MDAVEAGPIPAERQSLPTMDETEPDAAAMAPEQTPEVAQPEAEPH